MAKSTDRSYDLKDCYMLPGTTDGVLFKCNDNSGCFDMSAICDRFWQCKDGSDEQFDCCTLERDESNETHYGCGERMCIPIEKYCDGPIDCYWDMDEFVCAQRKPDANKNSTCLLPGKIGEWKPYKPDCSRFCGESPEFVVKQTRECVAYQYNETSGYCYRVTDPDLVKQWCFEKISYEQLYHCDHNHPCIITEISHLTAEGDHSSGTLSTFQFGFWPSTYLSFGYCDIGVIGEKKKGTQREKGTLDVFKPNVTCIAPMRLDGSEPGPLRVRVDEGGDGWNFDQVNITINHKVKFVYGKGLVWLGDDVKHSNVRATEVEVEQIIVLEFEEEEESKGPVLLPTRAPDQK